MEFTETIYFILLILVILVSTFVVFVLVSNVILKTFPHDHFLRKFWVKYVMTDKDLDPPTE